LSLFLQFHYEIFTGRGSTFTSIHLSYNRFRFFLRNTSSVCSLRARCFPCSLLSIHRFQLRCLLLPVDYSIAFNHARFFIETHFYSTSSQWKEDVSPFPSHFYELFVSDIPFASLSDNQSFSPY
jgi:hypothetical protein